MFVPTDARAPRWARTKDCEMVFRARVMPNSIMPDSVASHGSKTEIISATVCIVQLLVFGSLTVSRCIGKSFAASANGKFWTTKLGIW